MSSLSSDTLFHFTSKDALKSIIRSGFYPRFSCERFVTSSFDIEESVPMVCFCDIPLRAVIPHTTEYGEYGIGLKKSWASRNGISPVYYTAENSYIYRELEESYFDLFKDLMLGIRQGTSFLKGKNRELLIRVKKILQNMKPIQGISTKTGNQKIFYDENEWRYYPSWLPTGQLVNYLTTDHINYLEDKKKYTAELEQHPLTFLSEDISYIITSKNVDIDEVKIVLKERFNSTEISNITMISVDQIKKDL